MGIAVCSLSVFVILRFLVFGLRNSSRGINCRAGMQLSGLDGNAFPADIDLKTARFAPFLVELITQHKGDDGERNGDNVDSVTIHRTPLPVALAVTGVCE